ncbi:8-oxo-dGTP diphosphatase [Arthrobacter sp. V4I6]|uniref:8-oxo-dGTP diphosphatase n=1 Tax=unclassified Arthrobacter TaxID=235627 RepID=UPI00278259FE|nr:MULTISPECIES: 8-oxo-dGTP diphosphatase [unclassified Arthrobacter]MDQ0821815.1 8-oxo-dGTP diphosphatase [Arthrobacter sp. V1I7]MDQ0856081.1 8-oxo-dGTP diphosphatase [Arthrobacter sp. V4I6]
MKSTPVTLCFLLREEAAGSTEVLLGLKRTGFGTGKIVGIGGHVEAGETDAEAVCREVWEEAGIVVRQEDLAHAGVVEFVFPARPEWNMYCRLYTTRRWQGEPSESLEITPQWFDTAALPLHRMWQDAAHWLPAALAGEAHDVVVVLNDDNETVASIEGLSGRM